MNNIVYILGKGNMIHDGYLHGVLNFKSRSLSSWAKNYIHSLRDHKINIFVKPHLGCMNKKLLDMAALVNAFT